MNVLSNPNNHIQLSVHSPACYQEFRLHFSPDNTAGLFYYKEKCNVTMGDGKPCKKCGTSEWYDSGSCKECIRIAGKKRYLQNKGAKKEQATKWARNNPEKALKSNKKWKRNNPDKRLQHDRQWIKKNPDKVQTYNNNRRTRKTKAGGSYTAAEWKALKKQYNNRCACCGKKAKLTADHVIPVINGGTSDISNIQPLCKSCNSRKFTNETDYRTKPGILRWIQDKLL